MANLPTLPDLPMDRRRVRRLQAEVDLAGRIGDLHADLFQLLIRAHSIVSDLGVDGLPGQSMPEPVSGGSMSNPTMSAALSADQLEGALSQIHKHLEHAQDELRGARRYLVTVCSLPLPPAPSTGAQAACGACGRYVPGTPGDRVRAGFCGGCYMAWARAGKPDRSTFKRERSESVATP